MSSNSPLVSIVIPTYNAEAYIRSTVHSALAQSYEDVEILVVDDCSTDNTRAVVAELAALSTKVRLIPLAENSGTPARPRNMGVSNARGEWVAYLDADDLWHPRKLELQMALLAESGRAMCSSAMLDFSDEKEITHPPVLSSRPATTEISFKAQLMKYMTPTSSIVLRRDIALQHPFPEDRKYRGREDFACFLHVHETIKKSIKIMFPLVYYRQHNVQISRNKFDMAKKQLMILNEYRTRDGRSLGMIVYFYLVGHLLLSLYYRAFQSRL